MKQGRLVILGGPPRAGKTTLAVRLAHHGFNMLSFDHISEALQQGFPEIQVEDWTDQDACAKRLFPFFKAIVKCAVEDARLYGVNTVIDMYDYTPEYVSKLPFQDAIEVYYLAYPDFSVPEIRHIIRVYAAPTDWIAQVDEEYLDVVARRCSMANEKLVRQCGQYGYRLINTGAGSQRTAVLDDLFHQIIRA